MIRSPAAAAAHSPPPLISTAPSSCSTLSPLAPPFTVDRPLSPHLYPPPSAPAPPIPCSDAAPYYPYYSPSPADGPWNGPFDGDARTAAAADRSSSWMDPSSAFTASAFHKGTTTEGSVENEDSWGPWHGRLIGSTARKYQFGSKCSDWLDNEHSGIKEDYVKAPCNIPEMPALGTSALRKGPPYLHPITPSSIMGDCNSYSSNFAYDSYINQLVSCSMDTMVYYPDKYSPVQVNVVTPPARRASSSVDCRMPTNTYPIIQDVHPSMVRDDIADYVLGAKEFSHNVGYSESNMASSSLKPNKANFVESLLRTEDFQVGQDSSNLTTGDSTGCPMELNYGSRIPYLNLHKPFPYEGATVKPDDPMLTSPESFDQLNHSVDSPCWRGAPWSRHYPLGVGEEIDPYPSVKEPKTNPYPFVKEPKSSDDLVQHQKCDTRVLDNPRQDESLFSLASTNSSCTFPLREFPSLVSLPSREKEYQDASGKLSNYAKAGHVLEGQCGETLTEPGGYSEPKECSVKPLGHKGTGVSVDQPILEGETNLDTDIDGAPRDSTYDYGCCSPPRKDSQVLAKAIHALSEILLSMYCVDDHELKEHGQEVVQLVIDNLKILTLQSKKGGLKGNTPPPGLGTGESQVAASTADTTMKDANSKIYEIVNERRPYIGPSMCNDKFEIDEGVAAEGSGSLTDMTQVLKKGLEESLHEQEENPQALLYKKLWIEAEAALCSLKYARLKLEMENRKNQTTVNSHGSPKVMNKITQVLGTLNSPVLDGQEVTRHKSPKSVYGDLSTQDNVVGKTGYKLQEANTNKASEVDASIMDRYKVLTGRDEKLRSATVEDEENLVLDSSKPESEDNTGSKLQQAKYADFAFMKGDLEASNFTKKIAEVSRRLSSMPVLDGQDNLPNGEDVVGKNNFGKPQDASTTGITDFDASVMDRYRVLTNRDEKLSFASAENQEKIVLDGSIADIQSNTKSTLEQTKLTHLGFMEGNPCAYNEAGNMLFKLKFDSQRLGVDSEKLSFACVENQEKIVLDGSIADIQSNTKSTLEQTKLTDLGFMEGDPRAYNEAGNMLFKLKIDSKRLGADSEKPSFASAENQEKIVLDGSIADIQRNTKSTLEQTTLTDLGFMEGNPHAYNEAGNMLFKLKFDSQLLGADNEGNYSSPTNLERVPSMSSKIWATNGIINGKLKHVLSGGYESGSSEWEHVLNEEFTYNCP